jgi:DNA-binding TFAR19-related protein (PDSD5 family)
MMKEQRAAVMDQILTEEARIRLGNIAVVKPEKAERLENIIIANSQRGMF